MIITGRNASNHCQIYIYQYGIFSSKVYKIYEKYNLMTLRVFKNHISFNNQARVMFLVHQLLENLRL